MCDRDRDARVAIRRQQATSDLQGAGSSQFSPADRRGSRCLRRKKSLKPVAAFLAYRLMRRPMNDSSGHTSHVICGNPIISDFIDLAGHDRGA
jgi:hypothetical protein